MESQPIKKPEKKKQPLVVDNQTRPEPKLINVKGANKPIRCVNFVEIGDMEPKQIQLLVQQLGKNHDTAQGGIHYFIPVKHGHISSDMLFEAEILDFVQKICEVDDNGKIVLKEDAEEVEVIRRVV